MEIAGPSPSVDEGADRSWARHAKVSEPMSCQVLAPNRKQLPEGRGRPSSRTGVENDDAGRVDRAQRIDTPTAKHAPLLLASGRRDPDARRYKHPAPGGKELEVHCVSKRLCGPTASHAPDGRTGTHQWPERWRPEGRAAPERPRA